MQVTIRAFCANFLKPDMTLNISDTLAGDAPLELDEALFSRSEDFETRRPKQIAMPAFPTTTIGSFPQTTGAPLRTQHIMPMSPMEDVVCL